MHHHRFQNFRMFDRDLLRSELMLVDEWAARQIALADGLERLAGAVDLSQILHAVYTRLITEPMLQSVSRSMKLTSVSGGPAARSADTLGAMLIGHVEQSVPPAHNPLWRKILEWSLADIAYLEPKLRARARWFFAGPLPEGFLRTRYP